jgi:hypothetical protein
MHERESVLTKAEFESLLSKDGSRVDISTRCGLSAPFYIEGRPGKVTMFAPGLGAREKHILNAFAQRDVVVQVAAAQGLQVVVGKDFVDCGRTKFQGLKALQASRQTALLDCTGKHIIALIDSRNDAGIVEWARQFSTTGRKIIVFVGDDEEFVRDVLGQAADFITLPGGIHGTALVLQLLIDPLKSRVPRVVSRDCFDLRAHVQGIALSDLLVAGDMTGTILNQHPRCFPAETCFNLRTAIEQGTTFILVSGDALEVINDHFVIGDLPRPYYVISSGGYRIDQVERSRSLWTWTAPPIEHPAKTTLLEQAVATILESNPDHCASERT